MRQWAPLMGQMWGSSSIKWKVVGERTNEIIASGPISLQYKGGRRWYKRQRVYQRGVPKSFFTVVQIRELGVLWGQFNGDERTNRYQLIKLGNGVIAIWMTIEMRHFNYSEDFIELNKY